MTHDPSTDSEEQAKLSALVRKLFEEGPPTPSLNLIQPRRRVMTLEQQIERMKKACRDYNAAHPRHLHFPTSTKAIRRLLLRGQKKPAV